MTKLRKKLLLSVLTLALTFIALGSTTFAWFTLGNTATANAFSGTVQGGAGIDIALVKEGNENWTSYEWGMSIDLSKALEGKDLKFKDLTSENGTDLKNMEDGATTGNVDFAEISFYVRTLGNITGVKVSKINATSETFSWNPDATITGSNSKDFTVTQATNWNALNAVRLSFVATGKDLTGATPTNGTVTVAEFAVDDCDHGTADKSENSVATLYAKAKNFTIKSKTTPMTVTNRLDTKGENTTAYNLLTGLTTPYATQTVGNNTYNIYKVTFRVWMEGWDGDCINAILTKSVQIGFTLEATSAS